MLGCITVTTMWQHACKNYIVIVHHLSHDEYICTLLPNISSVAIDNNLSASGIPVTISGSMLKIIPI